MAQIGPEEAGQRVDNYLLRVLKGVPRSRIYRLLRKGEVRVNKGRVRADYRLCAGDVVRIPPVRTAERAEVAPHLSRLHWVKAAVIYEDDRLIVVNKPAGIAVHGGSGIRWGVIEALRTHFGHPPFLELVHRLDRDTSGCLLLAKRRSALRAVQAVLRAGGVDKRYLTLVGGRLPGTREVDAPLQKNVMRSGERVVRVDEVQGRAARSRFTPREWFRRREASWTLCGVRIFTGRTHQIRVHAAHMGHPIAGDEKYGDERCTRPLRELGLKRMFLHAESLRLPPLPWAPEGLAFHAPLPADLNDLLMKLRVDD